MEITLFFLAFALFWKSSQCIRCYKCEPERQMYENAAPLCEHFDGSDKYIVECPDSTMCFKRHLSFDFGNGLKTASVQRGCALQTIDGEQEKINGKWMKVKNIYEKYNEGCEEDPSDVQRATKTIHCYCRGSYCNSGWRLTSNVYAILVILAWMAIS